MSSKPSKPPPKGSTELWSRKIRVEGEVDRGGMSYVLKGTDTKLKREVALKVSPEPRDKLPTEYLARFIEEAQVTAQLEHPNVVPVHEIGLDPQGRVYFSMKLVRGRSLESILDARRAGDEETMAEFGLTRLLDVFLQVCRAIEYAHARGVIHRDLKPANIMVGGFGEVLVMDWGIAKVVDADMRSSMELVNIEHSYDELGDSQQLWVDEITSVRSGKSQLATQRGRVIGTPAYMSPEQAAGEQVDERADIYALGVILYEMLTGALPHDDDDTNRLLAKIVSDLPEPPSKVDPAVPSSLEILVLRLLEKDPARRVSIATIRSHIQSFIEGIERDYRRESLWSNALWALGALALFAFLVWYVTGQTIGALFVLAPTTIFNSGGWFLLILALRYPLWSFWLGLQQSRVASDPFHPGTSEDRFLSGFLAHRTFAMSAAPMFQLVFVIELIAKAVEQGSRGAAVSTERLLQEVRAEWGRALIVILLFLFGYLFVFFREVRFARRVNRYELLVKRPALESVWPVFLILLLIGTMVFGDVFDWVVVTGVRPWPYISHVLTERFDVFDLIKTFIFQATFLMGLVVATVSISFPFPELLASLRMPYQPADQAAVRGRVQYFLRSLAVFRVARVNWLYGGVVIGCLTALALSGSRDPLVERVLSVLAPCLVGYLGYWVTRRQLKRLLRGSPAVARMLDEEVEKSEEERTEARIDQLSNAPVHWRFSALFVPILCIAALLIFTGSGLHERAISQLVMPVTAEGWLLIVPYVMLLPLVVFGDALQLFWLRRKRAS